MTPDPSQTPMSQESGTSSAGRSTGSSIMRSALPLEELVDDDAADPGDREAGEPEQADEEEFEGEQLRHGPSLPAHPRADGATARAAAAMITAAPATLALARVTYPPGRRDASCTMSAPSTDAANTMPSAPYTPSDAGSSNQSDEPEYASETTAIEPTAAMIHTSTIPAHPPRVSEPACIVSPFASHSRCPASRSI